MIDEIDGAMWEVETGWEAGLEGDATEDGFDTGEEFVHAEGFDHVVIRAELESADAVGFASAGGEDDDGLVGSGGAEFAEE